jgi:hypothetical protein
MTMTEPTPASRILRAAVSPAMPDPITTTSARVVQPGGGAASRAGNTVTVGGYRAPLSTTSPRRSPLAGSAAAGSEPVPTIRFSESTNTTLGSKSLASAVSIWA